MPIKRLNWTLYLTVFMACFGSSFLVGYSLGLPNLLENRLQTFLVKAVYGENATTEDMAKEIEKKFLNKVMLFSLVSAVLVVGGTIGAFSCGPIAEFLGRRNSLLANHSLAIVGGTLCGLCEVLNSSMVLYVGRFLVGINCGITIGIASLYLTEIAPRHLRGAIGACNQLAITIGIAFAYAMTLGITLNKDGIWTLALGFAVVPALASLLVLPCCPESPRYLFLNKKDEQSAHKALLRLNPDCNADAFFGELREEQELAKSQPEFKFTQLFTQRDLLMPVLIACLIQVLQQLSGINAMIAYSSSMLKAAGVKNDYIGYSVLGVGIINVIMTVIALPLIERAGRRTLLLGPTVVVGVSLLLLTIATVLSAKLKDAQTALSYVSIVLILIYICGFAMGLGPIPALIVSEIFRQGPRAAAYSLSQGIQWTCNLIVLSSYPSIKEAIGGYSLLPFLFVVVVCWIFFWLFMPETKNRTFDEVARDLAFCKVVVGGMTTSLDTHNAGVYRKGDEQGNDDATSNNPLLMQQQQRV